MNNTSETVHRIYLFDGDQTEPIWVQPENYSTYDCDAIADQGSLSLPSIEELRRELNL